MEEGISARYLMYDLIICQLVDGVFGCVRAQKDAYYVLSVTFFCTFLDNATREALCEVQKCAEPMVLAYRQIADIVEQRFWNIAPQRLEN